MKLYFDNLLKEIKQSLRPVYLLSGDEPLQLLEAADTIRAKARADGFQERSVFHVERGFDWGNLFMASNTLSLFSEKKLIELRFNSCKVDEKGSKALIEYCETLSTDNVLMITMPKLDSNAQRSQWYKHIDKVAAVVQVWPIEIGQLPQWIVGRLKKKNKTISSEAASSLAEKVEGNMLAAAQEIEKLALSDAAKIEIEDILEVSSDDAKYDVYKLVDAILLGKVKRVNQIVQGLKASGEEPTVVLWALAREIRNLSHMLHERRHGVAAAAIFKKYRVWDKRIPIVKAGLARFGANQWSLFLKRALKVDAVIKGAETGNAWDELTSLSLSMAGTNV